MKFIGRNFNHFDIFFLSAMMRISDPTISIKLILKWANEGENDDCCKNKAQIELINLLNESFDWVGLSLRLE